MDETEKSGQALAAAKVDEEEMEVSMATQLENVIVTPESANTSSKTHAEETGDVHTSSTAAVLTLDSVCKTEETGDVHTASTAAVLMLDSVCKTEETGDVHTASTAAVLTLDSVCKPAPKVDEEEMEVSMTTQLENLIVTPESANTSSKTQTHAEETAAVLTLDGVCKTEDSDGDDSEDSDSDSSSSSSSSSPSPSAPVFGYDDDDEGFSQPAPIKTRDEVLLEELPAVEEVCVPLPEDAELQPVGTVSSIIQQLVIIQSLKDTPVLTDESILFRSDRLALAKVFEVFGPVSSPLYILRFNSEDQISSKGLTEGLTVYYAPAIKEYTTYILIKQLRLLKGSDASWKNDQEPPAEALDYSDDEKEQEAKRKIRDSKKKKDNNNTDNPDHVTQNTLQQQHDTRVCPPRHARPPFRHQNPRNKQLPFSQTHTPPRHTHPPAPMYLPPPCPYPPPPPRTFPPTCPYPPPPPHSFPPPNFPLYPPPPSFFNPSFSCPPWPPNSFDLPPPPPPPPPPQ